MPTVIFNPFRHGKEPDQVTGQSAEADSSTQITVSWSAVTASPPVTNYTIEWSANGSSGWAEIGESPTASTSVADASLSAYTLYYYRIKANNPLGSGDYSATTSATTDGVVPNQITGLTATVSSPDIVLSWNAATGGTPAVYTYTVQRSTSSGSGFSDLSGAVGISATTFTDTTPTMGTTYYYKVKGINAAGSGTYSSEASANVPVPTWTTRTDFPAARVATAGCCSTYTNTIVCGGSGSFSFEYGSYSFNGSTWSTEADMILGRSYHGCMGTSGSSCLTYGGFGNSWGTHSANYELWNGSTWTSQGNANFGSSQIQVCAGVSNVDVLIAGGYDGSAMDECSSYDGTSWTTENTLNASVYYGRGCGSGSAATSIGGTRTGAADDWTTICEKWNGTSWSVTGSMSTPRKAPHASGRSSLAMASCGLTTGGGTTATTETFDGSTWSSADASNTSTWLGNGSGTSSDALAFNGNYPSSTKTKCESFS